MSENLENIIDKFLLKDKKDNKINEDLNVKLDSFNLLKDKVNILENKIKYNDANLKVNYILPLFITNYLLMSIMFHFDKILKISNLYSTIIFTIIITLFFYKENMLVTKKILKKIFLKGE